MSVSFLRLKVNRKWLHVYTLIAGFCRLLQWKSQSLMFPSRCLQDFVTGLSILLRGTVREKLEWTFHLYDINRDGYINREVMLRSHSTFLHQLKSHCSGVSFPGNDRDCESHLWHDGQIHLPCAEGGRPTAARGRFLSGSFVITRAKQAWLNSTGQKKVTQKFYHRSPICDC